MVISGKEFQTLWLSDTDINDRYLSHENTLLTVFRNPEESATRRSLVTVKSDICPKRGRLALFSAIELTLLEDELKGVDVMAEETRFNHKMMLRTPEGDIFNLDLGYKSMEAMFESLELRVRFVGPLPDLKKIISKRLPSDEDPESSIRNNFTLELAHLANFDEQWFLRFDKEGDFVRAMRLYANVYGQVLRAIYAVKGLGRPEFRIDFQ